jgi:hypothetical protein
MTDTKTPRDRLYSRWGALKSERASYMSHWKEISDYLLPRNGRYFVTDRNKGERRHNNIYDNTGTRALRVLGAGLMGGATSPARPWFRLATADPDLMDYAPVKLWLSQVQRQMLDIFQRSNTYRALHSMYEEIGGFGTGASVLMDDFDQVIRHHVLTTGEFAIAQDYRGNVTTMYREFQKTVGEIVGEFGIENVSNSIKTLHDRGSLDAWVTLVHAIEPRVDRDPRMKDAKNMPFKSVYFELGSDQGKYLRESGFKVFRGLVPRWSVTGGDIYGSSPAMEALGDIKQLQHQQLRKAQAIDYMTRPPLQAPASMKNREIDMLPGGASYVDMNGTTGGIKTLFEVRLELNHLLADIQDVRGRINQSFYTDLFLMLANSTRTNMTATEVAERHEEKLLMLGPVLERLHNELLDPLIEITFTRMIEAGLVPPPPEELQGVDLNVQYVSMLAQAQRAVATNGIDRFVGNLGAVAQFKPEVLDKFDQDKWADAYSDMLGIDPELIVPNERVAMIRGQRAQAAAQAQQQAQNAQAAATARDLAAAQTGEESALTNVMGMFSGYNQ